VRAAFCDGFGTLGDAEGERTLLQLLVSDDHHYVRLHAAEALCRYGPRMRAAIEAQARDEPEPYIRGLMLDHAGTLAAPLPA
jgi:hypothetical protein